MISQKDEIKIAESLGIKIIFNEATRDAERYVATHEQMEEFNRQCGMLEEQQEQEAEIIRENQ